MSADADSFKCSYCDARYKHDRSRRSHEKRVHANRPSSKNMYRCKQCKNAFSKAGSLRWHINHQHHSERKKLFTKHLPTTSSTIKSVAVVGATKEGKKLKTKNGVQIVYANKCSCSYCPAFLSSAQSKEIHERRHIGKTSFVCESCGVSFYHLYTFRKHKLVCSYLHSALWCRYCDFYTFQRSFVEHHYRRVHGFRFQSEVEVEFLRREIGSEETGGVQPDPEASVKCERTESADDEGVSEPSIQVDSQIVELNQRAEMIVQQGDVSESDPNASPEYEETVASGSMEQCDHPRSPPSAESDHQKIGSNQRTETVVVQQHDGSEPAPNPSSECERTKASNNAELSHCNDRNTKPELESESHQRTELVVHQENIPIEDPIVKYEVEVAQIDENLKEIFKTPKYGIIDLTEDSDEGEELPSRVMVVDIDDDIPKKI